MNFDNDLFFSSRARAAQVGGWMGFFVGASVFSVLEVVALLSALAWAAAERALAALGGGGSVARTSGV